MRRNYEGPSKSAEEAGWHNTEIRTDCKPLTADTTMCTLAMLNHSVITQIHCPILVTNSSGVDTRQFLCQLMIFKCPWSAWRMIVYLDDHKQGKWKKQVSEAIYNDDNCPSQAKI